MQFKTLATLLIAFLLAATSAEMVVDINPHYDYVDYEGPSCGYAPLHPVQNGSIRRTLTAPYVTNGENIIYGHYPFLVLITIGKGSNRSICSGVIVGNSEVLATGYCVGKLIRDVRDIRKKIEPNMDAVVYAGKIHLAKKDDYEWQAEIESVQLGAFYSERRLGYKNDPDFAQIWIHGKFPFSNYIQPACVPKRPELVQRLSQTTDFPQTYVLGFGSVRTGDAYWLKDAERAQILKIKHEECTKEAATEICFSPVRNPDSGFCFGDQGGPVLVLDVNDRWSVVALAKRWDSGWGWGKKNASCYDNSFRPDSKGEQYYTDLSQVVATLERGYKPPSRRRYGEKINAGVVAHKLKPPA